MSETLAIAYVKETEEKKESFNLTDSALELGKDLILKCSNCDKPLVIVWINKPNQKLHGKPLKNKIKAECCYCKDESFEHTITGGFGYSGYYVKRDSATNPEDVVLKTKVTDIDGEDVLVFHTIEVKNG